MRRSLALAGVSVITAGLMYGAGTALAADVTVASVKAEIAALECGGSFSEDQGRIQDHTFELIGSITSAELGSITDALNARLEALNYCVDGGTTTPTAPATTSPQPTTSTPAAPEGTAPADCGELTSTQVFVLRGFISQGLVRSGGTAELIENTGEVCTHVVGDDDIADAGQSTLDITADDDSTADVSGDQVSDVPEGSVATGGA